MTTPIIGMTDLPQTKLLIPEKLSLKSTSSSALIVIKINEVINALNFLDEHINFLYERSRTQYNTLVAQGQGLQSVYDEFQEFKKRFGIFENEISKQNQIKSKRTKLDMLEHQDNN